MPRPKKAEPKVVEKKESCCNKQEIVELLKAKIPAIFDREPMGAMSQSGLENLANEICQRL